MKTIPIDFKTHDKHVNLLCLESYYLMVLRHLDVPFQALFLHAYLPCEDVIIDFVERQQSYLKYDKYKNVMIVGEELGVAPTVRARVCFREMVEHAKAEISKGMPIFIGMNPKELPQSGLMPWSATHYLMLNGIDRHGCSLIDDYPRRSFVFRHNETERAFQGELFRVMPEWSIDRRGYMQMTIDIARNIATQKTEPGFLDIFLAHSTLENLLYLRDGVGIARISRKQLFEWVQYIARQWNTDSSDLETRLLAEYGVLDRLYLFLELCRGRGAVNKETLFRLLQTLCILEVDTITGFGTLLRQMESASARTL